MQLNVHLYEDVAEKLKTYQYRKEVDLNYSHHGKMSDWEADRFVKDLCLLNELSRCAQHGVPFEENHQNISTSSRDTINTYQMLKHLICIRYNIEITTIKDHPEYQLPVNHEATVKKLNQIIEEIQMIIIEEIPEYKAAGWGESVFPDVKYYVYDTHDDDVFITACSGSASLRQKLNLLPGGFGACKVVRVDNYNSHTTGIKWPVRELNETSDMKIFKLLKELPNFDVSGNADGMRNKYYGYSALLVKHRGYIYNASTCPEIYFENTEKITH